MKKYTFYIGYHSEDCKEQDEVVIKDEEFEDRATALKLLRALKEIYNYLRTGQR